MSITLIIILVTVIISLIGFNNETFFNKLTHYPYLENRDKEYYRLLTAGFLHADMFHLFVNMFVLYNFGEYVETFFKKIQPAFGSTFYLLFYLTSIVLANLPNMKKHASNLGFRSIGASGATSAVVFSFIILNPWAKLYLFLALPIPAIVFGILYLLYANWMANQGTDNVDHEAHYYGALAGVAFTLVSDPSVFSHFLQQITQPSF